MGKKNQIITAGVFGQAVLQAGACQETRSGVFAFLLICYSITNIAGLYTKPAGLL